MIVFIRKLAVMLGQQCKLETGRKIKTFFRNFALI